MPAARSLSASALIAALTAVVHSACSSEDSTTTGTSKQDGGAGSGGLCPEVPTCASDGDPACLSIFPACRAGQCCADYVGCVECNCDAQCPAARPFCTNGLCGECASPAHCPAERPCCLKERSPVPIEGAPYACIPIGVRCTASR